jgi:prolipoprotein diacylglyceryltransferase
VWAHRADPTAWLGGKTIVGGLIGGWWGVEIAKRCLGLRTRTGDAYVIPLCLGIAIGRVGCFLTGLPDHTYGDPVVLPWAVDFGDGVPRHPTQIYEILWLLIMATVFAWHGTGWRRDTGGRAFRLFFVGYFLFRFAIEFIKPTYKPYAGLSAIQVASLIAAGVAAWQMTQATTLPRPRSQPA